MQSSSRVNIIVPCYNPPPDWEVALATRFKQFSSMLEGLTAAPGLIVVNDGSPNNATEVNFEKLRALIPTANVISYTQNRGKGYALRQGVAASDADIHLVTDTDFPYTLESMRKIVETTLLQGGIAAGNRDTRYYEKVPYFRRQLSRSLRWMLRHVLRQPIDDSQCGLKGFDHSGKDLFLETTIDRFLFDLEFLMLAKNRVKVTPVQVELREGVVFSKVGWKVLAAEGKNFIRLLFK